MLPYPSYLRVYEPVSAFGEAAHKQLTGQATVGDASSGLAAEQHTVLARAVMSSVIASDAGLPAAYMMRHEGMDFVCPMDMPLRSWLSLSSLVESVGNATVNLLLPAETLSVADAAFLQWRREHPAAVPHIRQATWGIPRTWFLLVVHAEREEYGADGTSSIRYRARITDAQRRVAAAEAVLHRILDETEFLEEVADLARWLEAFDDTSWIELDYAGVAQLLGEELASDESADEVQRALRALRDGDIPAAGAAYRSFEARWRAVNAYERAN